jgi:flavin-dependent dehydrogenase
MDVEVVIAGAGPAGVATAVALVRNGLSPDRILCLDRASFPRAKPCGGGLTGHAAAALRALGLTLRTPSVPCDEGELVFGRQRRTVSLLKPVHVVRREEFDRDLVLQARALGVRIVEGEGLRAFEVEPARGVHVTTDARTLRARVLVGADGAGSLVRKALLGPEAGRPRQPLRLARLELPAPRPLGRRMIYDFTPIEDGVRGYVWLFPVAHGRVNVGIMHYPASALGGRELNACLERALRRYDLALPGPARGWPAWPYHPDHPVSGPHVLCVGDAAGIDALTGEGIAVGLEHGPLAATAILEARTTGDWSFAGYRRALRRATVGRELALDRWLAQLLYGARDPRSWLGLVFGDARLRALYAARVCGSEVLADRKLALLGALARHAVTRGRRRAALAA